MFNQIFRPNYVSLNKRRIGIKIKSNPSESFSFKRIKSSVIEHDLLKITKVDGQQYTFKMDQIEQEDTDRLGQIILDNTISTS